MFPNRYALLLDGGFVRKAVGQQLKRPPTAEEILNAVKGGGTDIRDHTLYRIFYYTADPATGKIKHPLTKATTNLSATEAYHRNRRLIDTLENSPDVAVRRGTLTQQGWHLKRSAKRQLLKGTKTKLEPNDIEMRLGQKGVDMRIGLDIASLALKRLVSTVILVTGDSDMIPAMKFARREGLRVVLNTLGQASVRPELKLHADVLV